MQSGRSIYSYKAIILDVDGTLYYQLPLRLCMAMTLIFHYAVHIGSIKELLVLRFFRKLRENDPFADDSDFEARHIETIAAKFKLSPERVEHIINVWMLQKPLKYVRLFRDRRLIRIIGKLKSAGAKVVLYSDYPVKAKLEVLKPLEVDFCFASSDEGIKCLKPNPKGLLRIMEVLNSPASDMIMIGDRYKKDGKAAENCGVDYIILKTNPASRYFQLRRMTEKASFT